MIYFISGHRDITRAEFEYWYVPIIKNAVEHDKHARFVLGECEGVDSMALEYLDELAFNPDRVTVIIMLRKQSIYLLVTLKDLIHMKKLIRT